MKEVKFNFSQAVLLEYGSETTEYLKEDLPVFTEFDPDLNEDKRQHLSDLLEEALVFGTDSTQRGILSGKTGVLKAEMLKCHILFESVKYFAYKGFGDNKAIIKQFRIKEYGKIRYKQDKLIVFMYEFAETVDKYRAGLILAGMKEAAIDDVKLAAETLNRANVVQETGKGGRSVVTSQRATLLNSIFDVLKQFNHASKIVFANDPVRRDRYKLPSNNSTGGDDEDDE